MIKQYRMVGLSPGGGSHGGLGVVGKAAAGDVPPARLAAGALYTWAANTSFFCGIGYMLKLL